MTTSQPAILRRRWLLTSALLLAVVSCTHTPPGAGSTEKTLIQFSNESLSQADVFVAAPGTDARRIGTVMAGQTETLEIPPDVAIKGNVTIFARLLARTNRPSSGPLAISPGTKLSVRLPLDTKTLFVLPAA
jgi:hypothetical protein